MESKQTQPGDNRDRAVEISGDTHSDLMSIGTGSGLDIESDNDSAAQTGWSSVSITKWDQCAKLDRRSEKIRSWRRRALLKRGARLHEKMAANAQANSLAMLDETGLVVCWYGSPDGRDYASDEVVDRHLSLFYVSEEVARRQPHRDLRAAVTEGRLSRLGWRRRPDGSAFWSTIVIEPVVLRDGRVQGFSYVASAPDQSRQVVL